MEKPLLVFSILALGFVLYNYSNFENADVAYFLVLICCAFIIFSIVKIKYPNSIANDEYESVEKEIDALENFNGIFRYEEKGFHFVLSEKSEYVKWEDIVEVNSFSITAGYRTKHSGIEVVTAVRNFEFNQEYIPGIEKLSNQLYENLPYWNVDAPVISTNNYGLEKINLYKKLVKSDVI